MSFELPVLGVCGWSGSGKTMLVEELARRLVARRLAVAVVKHDAHGFDVDREGKDSDRFFRAGADAVLIGLQEGFCRFHHAHELPTLLHRLAPRYDVILVEGHKSTPLPRKVWLMKDGGDACPPEASPVVMSLGRDEDRVGIVMRMLDDWLPTLAKSTPVCAGILFGGSSTRMGEPKHLLRAGGIAWLERTAQTIAPFVEQVVLLGGGEVPASLRSLPALPDVSDKRGPLAGMLAAMRWRPWATWLFAACDLPRLSADAVRWLLGTRAPGVWAALPRLPGAAGVEPLLAHYDFRAAPLLENCRAPSELAHLPQVLTPVPPAEIADAWRNVNTPDELTNVNASVA
ncbi:MAG: molybdopterin-guanine dinucleotide biosynthesis protein B [Verrucomicrobia bacterium]|nr:molybdopterin-guanine dinucleotide biosynthesis protein B [Verrucomicrobiota bacterium]